MIMKITDIMTKDLVRVEENTAIAWVISKMKHFKIRSLIVERVDKNEPYGMITVRDVVYKVIAKGLDPETVEVKDIMSEPAVYVSSDMDVKKVAQFMAEKGVSRVLVKKEDKLVGIASLLDILKAF
ncbi:MAG TPA: CBS domain-containing protein [Candidatus Desulfofervidus auxilii]|uniref:CBS domain-containing protein n=2 Tax=Desulfofervidus auxilii TaxID=1621989 RepID=A0A7C1VUE7_DESA2|nr:CBS domain-containing protein [Candidatus Desulfofervidus auxilii]